MELRFAVVPRHVRGMENSLVFAQIFVALEMLRIRHRSIGDPFSPIHVEQLPFWKVVDSYRVSGVEFSSLM